MHSIRPVNELKDPGVVFAHKPQVRQSLTLSSVPGSQTHSEELLNFMCERHNQK
jgi:hypothetical protein